MASVTSNCFMNMKPPPSSSSPSPLRRSSTHVSWPRKEGSWRRNMVLGMACMIITLQNGELNFTRIEQNLIDVNAESTVETTSNKELAVESKKGSMQLRWSNQRQCQPWRLNQLETIVPENLPRPSAHRRWEKVNHSEQNAAAAAAASVKMLTNIDNKCFTM